MTIPTTIPFTSIVFGPRARTTYSGIEELADSMRLRGNVTPIGLHPLPDSTYLLVHGGRRYRAMELLGITELEFGIFGVVGKGGYVLADPSATDADDPLFELIENLHRKDLDWRDEVKLIVKGWRHEKRKADVAGEELIMQTYGQMLGGLARGDIVAACRIHDDVFANPEKYAKCNTIQMAYQAVFLEGVRAVEAELARRVTTPKVEINHTAHTGIDNPVVTSMPVVDLSTRFRLGNSLDWMEAARPMFDHIICDPDFAVSKERLEAGVAGAAEGVAQDSIEESLQDLYRLISLASFCVRNYFIFFYDLDHHEKLQQCCASNGFAVQRWPILWHKLDHGGNASPQHNFTKNMEYAMVCRKPDATLATAAPKAVIALPSANTTATFGHPFAKPIDLWLRIFSAVCRPGQTVFDPFMGSGSSTIAAIRFGLSAQGMELQEQHFNRALLNIQAEYKRQMPEVTFR